VKYSYLHSIYCDNTVLFYATWSWRTSTFSKFISQVLLLHRILTVIFTGSCTGIITGSAFNYFERTCTLIGHKTN